MGLSIDGCSGVISGTIGAGAASDSPYSVTVTATQTGASVSATETFDWTVTQLYLYNPGRETNLPGDSVDLLLQSGDGLGGTASFSATGLPSGLIVDSDGEITGTITTDAAASSPYAVTVTETDGGASVSKSFNWYVQQLKLSNPGAQYAFDGETISLPVSALAPIGDTITFAATGLPAGLTINAATGSIAGKIGWRDDTAGPYNVTLTATDTSASISASKSFLFNVDSRNIPPQTLIQTFLQSNPFVPSRGKASRSSLCGNGQAC